MVVVKDTYPDETIKAMRDMYENNEISMTQVARKFNMNEQYTKKILSYLVRAKI